MKYYLDHKEHLSLYLLGFNIVLFNLFMLLLKQCRHIVQKAKYDQKIYVRKNTSWPPQPVPRVNTSFTFWTCSSDIHLHVLKPHSQPPSSLQSMASVVLLDILPGNESLAFLGCPLPLLLHCPPITHLVTITGRVYVIMTVQMCLAVPGLSCIAWYLLAATCEPSCSSGGILFPGQRWNLGPRTGSSGS